MSDIGIEPEKMRLFQQISNKLTCLSQSIGDWIIGEGSAHRDLRAFTVRQ
jgi:hypothetical protein